MKRKRRIWRKVVVKNMSEYFKSLRRYNNNKIKEMSDDISAPKIKDVEDVIRNDVSLTEMFFMVGDTIHNIDNTTWDLDSVDSKMELAITLRDLKSKITLLIGKLETGW